MMGSFGLSPLIRAAAVQVGAPVTGDVRWFDASPAELRGLTETDKELIYVATSERIPDDIPEEGLRVSFYVLQIAMDRLAGPLKNGEDISVEYAEHIHTMYEEGCPDGNPFSGDLLDMTLAFLVGRELGRLGPDHMNV
ncbi:hypothetical protein [Dermatophilus congolensis]|uniref:Uncharacterized protein n=1 Tax=Dermatophilus congolensis TaxID=1863 RepID=A0A239V6K9_9MICO|nr:hypothetical protein [Dermatophilus congolensis]MBO3130203.1 hypothetical protein [Dermatophilus congolensis]MBO3131170.1 hypothetical protein [Dermatophilus congolensis]MBO3134674.1 hypothetical protein [Dermatophilus congolensis]MBO3136911.1 hypothetical protein [Dermatophilus congolensis]MBO3139155.1 hypothetical protein [Dermatophilus congolensis]